MGKKFSTQACHGRTNISLYNAWRSVTYAFSKVPRTPPNRTPPPRGVSTYGRVLGTRKNLKLTLLVRAPFQSC